MKLLLIVASMTLHLSLAPDVDIYLPSGTPLEWRRVLPVRGVCELPMEAQTGEGAQISKPRYAQPGHQVHFPSALSFLTLEVNDLEGHFPWLVPEAIARPPETPPFSHPYPPTRSRSLDRLSKALLLSDCMRPSQTSSPESLALLLEIGDGTVGSLTSCRDQGSLHDHVVALEALIGSLPPTRPDPPEGASAFDTMMLRFVAEELVAAYPYDPDLDFGRSLFLLGDTVAPYVGMCVRSEHSFLRRNAVLALSRFETYRSTRDLLIRVLDESGDVVTRLRAISGLVRLRSLAAAEPLARTLEQSHSLPLSAALIHALGLLGDARSLPAIEDCIRRSKNPDLSLGALMAVARIRDPGNRTELLRFIEEAKGYALSKPRKSRSLPGGMQPDHPDPPGIRSMIVGQAAHLARLRVEPGNARLASEILDLAGEEPLAESPLSYRNLSLGLIHSMLVYPFIESLPRLGPQGRARLIAIVRDRSCEPVLRCHALSVANDLSLAYVMSRGRKEDPRVVAYALESLDAADHPSSVSAAEEWLSRLEVQPLTQLSPAQMYACHVVLRLLARRGRAGSERLLRLLDGFDLRPEASQLFRAEITVAVQDMVAMVRASNEVSDRTGKAISKILDAVLARGVRTRVKPDKLDFARAQIGKWLQTVVNYRSSEWMARSAEEAIVAFLLDQSNLGVVLAQFHPESLVIETAILALGSTGSSQAVRRLVELLDQKRMPYRGAACLALGRTGTKSAAARLLSALEDFDPFVRLCAALGLEQMTGRRVFADWLYGHPTEWSKARGEYALAVEKELSRREGGRK